MSGPLPVLLKENLSTKSGCIAGSFDCLRARSSEAEHVRAAAWHLNDMLTQ